MELSLFKNFRSQEQKYHGMELSLPGTFVPWNFRSRERFYYAFLSTLDYEFLFN